MKKQQLFLIYAAFGLSGFAALVYQIVWIRELSTFFGIQVYSTTTVLSAFMAGLALGSWFFGKIADRMRNPLNLFVIMELGLAAYALAFPYIKEIIASIYLNISPQPGASIIIIQFSRFVAAFPILLIATSLMGGTLPVLTKGITYHTFLVGKRVSLLYGSNNLGAFFGGFITGYILLQTTGIAGALIIGAIFNTLNAFIVFFLNLKSKQNTLNKTPEIEHKNYKFSYSKKTIQIVLWVFALEGFTTLAYEIIWSRILYEFSYDKTSFFYTTIIIAFVGGLSAGSYLISTFINRIKDPVRLLSRIQFLIGFSFLLLFSLFLILAPHFHQFRESQETWFMAVGLEQIFIFLIVTPPVILMGFTFPLVSIIYSSESNRIGRDIGAMGALDTIGSVAGAIVTGFLILPIMGSVKSFLFIALINVILGIALLLNQTDQRKVKQLAVSFSFCIAGLLFLIPQNSILLNKRWNTVLNNPVLLYDEGPAASVAVTKYRNNHLALSINGAITAHTIINDVQVHKLLATLPWMYCETPRKALVIGLGIGITTNTLQISGVPEITVAEISPEVMKASREQFGYFINHQGESPLFLNEDGRALLYRTNEKFNIITTNAVHPRLGNSIYTKDFYELCAEKLDENGIMCQWLPTNWMNESEYKTLIRTFTDVYEYTSLWNINDAHTILLGSKNAFDHSYNSIAQRLSSKEIKEYLEQSFFIHPTDILKHFCMGNQRLKSYGEGAILNTDDKPIIEFSRVVDRSPNIQIINYLLANTERATTVFHDLDPNSNTYLVLEYKQQNLINLFKEYSKLLDEK